jgi:hypothetical protein
MPLCRICTNRVTPVAPPCAGLCISTPNEREKQDMPMFIDLTGQKFGRLTVLYRGANTSRAIAWICNCSCSLHALASVTSPVEKITVRGVCLRNGTTRSCGCLRAEKARSRGIDLTGRTVHSWRVLQSASNRGLHRYWLCQCVCQKGTVREVSGASLLSGRSRSCGCLRVKKISPVELPLAA